MVKTFANHPITLKTSIKYHKEYDRDTEQEIMALLEENDNAKDFSWEPKIEDADEIEKAQAICRNWESVCWFVLWFQCLPGLFWKRMELLLRGLKELSDLTGCVSIKFVKGRTAFSRRDM